MQLLGGGMQPRSWLRAAVVIGVASAVAAAFFIGRGRTPTAGFDRTAELPPEMTAHGAQVIGCDKRIGVPQRLGKQDRERAVVFRGLALRELRANVAATGPSIVETYAEVSAADHVTLSVSSTPNNAAFLLFSGAPMPEGAARVRVVTLPSCGPSGAGFQGGLLVTQPACVTLKATSDEGGTESVQLPVGRGCDVS